MLLKKPIIIGIAGGSASGKTTIAQMLYDSFEKTKSVTIIREDDYYKDQSHMAFEDRVKTNYDHPFAFDHDLMESQIKDLLNGITINKPVYDFTVHNRSEKIEVIEPRDVIIIEGLFVLEEKCIRDLLDIKIYVDTPYDVRFIRRMTRDIKERARQLDNIINQWLNTVRVMHEEFVEPSKKYANIIIPEGANNKVAIDLLITKIDSILNQ
ncbi:MAG: uridine kinase [Erysipelotrichaceae bacterium]|nr:uridine kinase [Erysipelotrichaceae bacterium]